MKKRRNKDWMNYWLYFSVLTFFGSKPQNFWNSRCACYFYFISFLIFYFLIPNLFYIFIIFLFLFQIEIALEYGNKHQIKLKNWKLYFLLLTKKRIVRSKSISITNEKPHCKIKIKIYIKTQIYLKVSVKRETDCKTDSKHSLLQL